MPLREGRDSIAWNIKRLLDEYESTGMIGNVRPKNKKQAIRVAKAVAMSKAKKSK